MNVQLNRSLQDIRAQFEQDTFAEVKEAKTQGEKLIKTVKKQVTELRQTAEALQRDTKAQLAKGKEQLSKSRKGGDYWRTVKLTNELGKVTMDEVETLELPDKVSYDTLRTLTNSLSPILTKIIKMKRAYDPYITPYFIRARRNIGSSLVKLQDLVRELGDFTSSTYRRVRHIEKTLEGIDRLGSLLEDLPPIENFLAQEKAQGEELTRRIKELEEEHANLTKETLIKETSTLAQEIRTLELKAFKKLRVFRDPLKKMLYRSKGGGPGLSPDLREVAEGYMEHTLERFRTEELGHPTLSGLLCALKTSLEQEAVFLKKRKETKTIKIMGEILDKGVLQKIQENIAELEAKKQHLMKTDQYQALQSQENEIQTRIQELRAAQAKQEKIIGKTEKTKEQKLHQIEHLAQRITQNIHSLSGTSLTITLNNLTNTPNSQA